VPTSVLDDLQQALADAGRLVEALRDDQWGASTPCSDWDVRDVVRHLTAGNALFAGAIAGKQVPDEGVGLLASDAAAYARSVELLVTAATTPEALDQLVSVPFGVVPGPVAVQMRVVEALVHGWDVARATGQPTTFADDLVDRTDAFTRQLLERVPPGRSPFHPPAPAADDAPPLDRLAALLGRSA
jgi:uncharacterized protein (TIGR03086 family)